MNWLGIVFKAAVSIKIGNKVDLHIPCGLFLLHNSDPNFFKKPFPNGPEISGSSRQECSMLSHPRGYTKSKGLLIPHLEITI